MNFPSLAEVMDSVTDEEFHLRNWLKHRNDPRHGGVPYPFHDAYTELDGQRFTRQHVFQHFAQSTIKGINSAIKWGYPRGGRPGGRWHAFSDALRTGEYADAIERMRQSPSATAQQIVLRLNAIVVGVGTATTTKMAYFAGLAARGGPTESERSCLIYDSMVRRAIWHRTDEDFGELHRLLRDVRWPITPNKEAATYGLYLDSANRMAERHNVRMEQIELFLFRCGRTLQRPA